MRHLLLLLLVFWAGCNRIHEDPSYFKADSPSENNSIEFHLGKNGEPTYLVKHKGKIVLDTARLGFVLHGAPPMQQNFQWEGSELHNGGEDWTMPWGEQRIVHNYWQELKVYLRENEGLKRRLHLYLRAMDDGVAIRYEFPKQENMDTVRILNETTRFQLTTDPTCYWIPGDWDIYEHLYNTTPFSKINALEKAKHVNLAQTHIPENSVNTPVTMRQEDGLHLSFHEANLTDYAGMTLRVDTTDLSMESGLVGSDNHPWKVERQVPFFTPWRTVQISEDAAGLLDSRMIVNLNDPNKIGDVSWFQPKKYVGIWWEMHIGKASWDLASGRHGATTENAKRYIDFAAENGFGGVLVEGWNTGWEHWIGFEDREGVFDFVTPYPDYDLEEVVRYANEKGVELIMHHETSAAPRTYEQQMDTAFKLMNRLGIHSVKTGYVGPIIPKGEYHHGQWMVRHYRKVLTKAAEHNIAINAHEPIKATGLRRTYPNAIAREGLRGQEFNAWAQDGGNPPEHISIVAFTRMLAGPIDFTPGAFSIKLDGYKDDNQINTTLAHQLALYVVIYSPLQMACDLPEHYEGQPAFQFIRDVGVNWEQSKVLAAEVGDFVVMAREERKTGAWFIGGVTDEEARDVDIELDFLEEEKDYAARIYQDGPDAHWDKAPLSIEIGERVLKAGEKLKIRMAPGGGFAISLIPKD